MLLSKQETKLIFLDLVKALPANKSHVIFSQNIFILETHEVTQIHKWFYFTYHWLKVLKSSMGWIVQKGNQIVRPFDPQRIRNELRLLKNHKLDLYKAYRLV